MSPGYTPYGAIEDAVVIVDDGAITWVGPRADAPRAAMDDPARTLDAKGGWITPGLIDAHTHLVFGGNRADEFERRLAGERYEDIARSGGGILSTVRATRAASASDLEAASGDRLDVMCSQGVTTIEIKSGYGLDVDTELRMLAVARGLGATHPVTVRTTLLAAHALPPEYAGDRPGYLDLVCDEVIPRAARDGLADAVDAFCEGIAFDADECVRVLEAGARHGLAGRLHADQLSDAGGAEAAARAGAASADHLEHTSEAGVTAMARSGTAAVLLPGAYYFLGGGAKPPIEAFRRLGVPMGVASDANPGSSPVLSPLTTLNMACVLFGLTPEEALAGMTRHAAKVLGMDGERGVVAPGSRADLAIWAVGRPAELAYWVGGNPCTAVVREGRIVREVG